MGLPAPADPPQVKPKRAWRRKPNRQERRLTKRCHRSARLLSRVDSAGFEPLDQYADDPVGFARDILGIEVWAKQAEILEAIRDNPRVTVAACYASGKTFCMAIAVLWWLYTRRPALVVTTAPTNRQVKKLLWRNLKSLHRKARVKLPGKVLTQELILDDDQQAMGFSGSTPDSVQGLHEAENVLFIEDEASGISDEVVEGFAGITASPNSKHVKIGNPVCTSGPFWESHNGHEAADWVRITISAFDTPNVVAGRVVVKGLVTLEWVEERRRKWKEDSPLWRCKVLGEFVAEVDQVVIPIEWARSAQARWAELAHDDSAPISLAIDIGRTIDESVITARQGRRLWVVDRFSIADATKVVDKLCEWVDHFGERVYKICIDATGYGASNPDILWRKIEEGAWSPPSEDCQILAVGLGKRAQDPETYDLTLDELQWRMREALDPTNREALAISPDDGELVEELPARRWDLTRRGKIKVETKADLKRRHIKSPNLADSAMLHFYESDDAWLLVA